MEPKAKPLARTEEINIALGIILSVVTCGIYNVYWNYRQFKTMNTLLGREEFNFVMWLVLSLVTCGIYHVYYEYKMGTELHNYMKSQGHEVNPSLAVVGLALSCVGLTVVADAIYQQELNKLCA